MSERIASNEAVVDRLQLKRRYRVLLPAITAILFEEDLMGLASAGAPPDEYEPEAGSILPRLGQTTGTSDVQAVVASEFERWFGVPVAAERAAERIWAAWTAGQPAAE